MIVQSASLAKLACLSASVHAGLIAGYAAFSFESTTAPSVIPPDPLIVHVVSAPCSPKETVKQAKMIRHMAPKKPAMIKPVSCATKATPPAPKHNRALVPLGSLNIQGAYTPEPMYPKSALRRQQTGLVMVTFMVDDRGNVSAVTVQDSSGVPSLDQAALEAVKTWRFPRAVLSKGQTVSVPIRFMI